MNDVAAARFDAGRYAQLSPAAYPRVARIATAFAKAGWAHYVGRIELPVGQPRPSIDAMVAMDAARLRATIEQLGPTFVKFGQLLSARRDLLPDAYVDEFSKLQDQVPVDTQTDAVTIIRAELGKLPAELFAEFDRAPFAAASMAQVHGATLLDGSPVVVKVQRHGIEEQIHADLGIMHFLARQLERHVAESRRFAPVELVDEFARNIVAELDFRREGRNADRFAENFRDDPSVLVPRVFWDQTTPRVLTMQRSDGIRAVDYAVGQAESRRDVAANLVRVFLVQLFEHGVFHGDPHPGNVFVMADGRLCFHDFGIVGTLALEDQENLAQLLMGVVVRDPRWVAEAYFAMGVAGAEVDRRTFTRDVEEALSAFYDAVGHGPAFSEILHQFIRLGQRHRIRLPRAFLSVAKAFMQVESQALLLDPAFDVVAALQSFAPRFVKRMLVPDLDRAFGFRTSYQRMRAARTALDALTDIASRLVEGLREGKLHVELHGEELQQIEERVERASNRLSFSMIIASIVIASAIVMSFHAGPHYDGVSLLGVAGFAIAGMLGLWWAIAVLRSGRL
jgi:ubiquinone biosynthesis protein